MEPSLPIPWEIGNEFLLACGSVHTPFQFCVTVLERIRDIVPYDQALFLMLNGNRKVIRSHFVEFSERWSSMYLNYYSKCTLNDFSLDRDVFESQEGGYVELVDWKKLDWIRDDFIKNYIKPRRLNQSLSFTLFDLKGFPATTFSLDRLVDHVFHDEEVEAVRLAALHLNNFY